MGNGTTRVEANLTRSVPSDVFSWHSLDWDSGQSDDARFVQRRIDRSGECRRDVEVAAGESEMQGDEDERLCGGAIVVAKPTQVGRRICWLRLRRSWRRRQRRRKEGEKEGVSVFVMILLDSLTARNALKQRKMVNTVMAALKSPGVEGVMMDVWWGLVEREKPGEYNWGGYVELMEMAKKHGLKVQAVMSFHQCGGNVGDSCT